MKYLIIVGQKIYKHDTIPSEVAELAANGAATIINLEAGTYYWKGTDQKELATWGAVSA